MSFLSVYKHTLFQYLFIYKYGWVMDWIRALEQKENNVCIENHTDKTDRTINPSSFLWNEKEEKNIGYVENGTDKTDETFSAEEVYEREERSAIMQYDGGLSREDADRLAGKTF